MNDRTQALRQAFRKGDLTSTRRLHDPHHISEALHGEPHNQFSLSQVILGGQDGLVNVLGVILGVAAASNDPRIVIAGGLAATFAESVSMGAVAYTSTIAEAEHYQSELRREKWEIENYPEGEKKEIRQIYENRGFSGRLLEEVVGHITANKKVWLEIMMSEELKLQPIATRQALHSAIIVGLSALGGSLIPLVPFFIVPLIPALIISLIFSALTLFLVGAYKATVTIGKWYRSGLELMTIGIISAFVGYIVGLLFKAPIVP